MRKKILLAVLGALLLGIVTFNSPAQADGPDPPPICPNHICPTQP